MNDQLKVCKTHGLYPHVTRTDRLGARCRKCASLAVSKRRRVLKQKAVALKGGKCQACGYDKCIDALDLHHLDSSSKEFSLGGRGLTRSWAKIQNELAKCKLLCANCHREAHYMERCSSPVEEASL